MSAAAPGEGARVGAPGASFASDNHAGAHPAMLEAMARANGGYAPAYGADELTRRAEARIGALFDEGARAHFVFNGTAANVTALAACLRPFEAVICAESAHIQVDECGAPERFTGAKLLTVPTPDGKLTPELVASRLGGQGVEHHSQARVVSISQTTEWGTLYRAEEIRRLAEFAHSEGLLLHVDGARLANAAAALDLPLRAFTTDAGVDVVGFGGTKNGLIFGEPVVFLRPGLGEDFKYVRKQSMQLASKMRFVSAQFEAALEGDLWLENARHANLMARRLASGARAIPGVRLVAEPEANAVFAELPAAAIPRIQARHPFYVWDAGRSIVRWMTSFATRAEDVDSLLEATRQALA